MLSAVLRKCRGDVHPAVAVVFAAAAVAAGAFAVVCKVCNESLLDFSRLRLWGKPLFAKVQLEINLPVSGLTEPRLSEVEL